MRVVVTAVNSAGQGEVASALVGATASAAAATPAAPGTAPAAAAGKRVPKSKAAMQLERLRLTPEGQLLLTLACPKKAKARCGSTGSFASGRIASGLSTNAIARGKRVTKTITLTKPQLRTLRGKQTVRFLVRIAAPATPTRPRVRRVTVKVPRKLSGPIRKPRTAAQRRAAAKQRAAAKKRAAAERAAAENATAPAA
jgi:hypothetical protein